jgi:hypothetical protein
VQCINGLSLPCELAGAECGDRMREIAIDPAANRIGNALDNCFGSANLVADTPTAANIEDALGNGVAIVSYNAQGTPIIVRPITTHSQDSVGNPDRRVFDTSGVDGMYAVANDIKVRSRRSSRRRRSRRTSRRMRPPAGGRRRRARHQIFLVERLRFWSGARRRPQGHCSTSPLPTAPSSRQVNATDPTQVDIVLPYAIFPPLAKFGVYMQKVA